MTKAVNQSAFRVLTGSELDLVSGGDKYISYRDTDGSFVTEHWSDDMSTFYGLSADWSGGGSSVSDAFACVGIGDGIGAGLCVGGGDLFTYGSLGLSPTPVDITVGTATDAQAYLTGLSIAANGLPGGGESLNSDGTPAAVAVTTGTPGASVSYGTDVSELLRDIGSALSNGFYNQLGRPYDSPGDTTGRQAPTEFSPQ